MIISFGNYSLQVPFLEQYYITLAQYFRPDFFYLLIYGKFFFRSRVGGTKKNK